MKESFGHFLRKNRKDLGMNQTQLAVKLHMDAAKLSKIENGKMIIDEPRLELLSKAINIDLQKLKTMYYGDCVARTLYKNRCSNETLNIAEEILEYYKTNNAKQGNLTF
ncbi:helix-turn-helix transcriptional regulator [uncultured Draconibacterium sp.]|uniref:helix-turn-helix domain-containing protein n=1 Tax=uncultured Draconibacterium sp. TaxID=1573823 RepID=UPI002AA76AD4|nr:helix-turn-helix transcriptional regulator [uncultured Draconibacterium sp.]